MAHPARGEARRVSRRCTFHRRWLRSSGRARARGRTKPALGGRRASPGGDTGGEFGEGDRGRGQRGGGDLLSGRAK
jgi:hypothetical protein